jgi:hypothetical protein
MSRARSLKEDLNKICSRRALALCALVPGLPKAPAPGAERAWPGMGLGLGALPARGRACRAPPPSGPFRGEQGPGPWAGGPGPGGGKGQMANRA